MIKNYIGFSNDHSNSMTGLATAALKDYNANITAVKESATKNMLDTIVSVNRFGLQANRVERFIVNSNPHVLNPLTEWPCNQNTPLYDAVGDMIELFKSLPDYNSPDVSFLLMITTDGEEYGSQKYSRESLRKEIEQLSKTERWTFVFRVPKGHKDSVQNLGVPDGNIQEWETTVAGMAASTAATTQAVDSYFTTRSAGKKGTNVFYANAAEVSVKEVKATLEDISKKVSLYVVPGHQQGIQIRDFIHEKRMEYLKGAAFYQLTKTEPRVQDSKLILIRDRKDGKIYHGAAARQMIGLPTVGNARLHPGDHGNYDLFIQSTSVNRKLVAGTGVVYWKEIGIPFTAADLEHLKPVVVKPSVVVLPAVTPTNKPTPSPIAPTPKFLYFASRKLARDSGKSVNDAGRDAPYGKRWFVKN